MSLTDVRQIWIKLQSLVCACDGEDWQDWMITLLPNLCLEHLKWGYNFNSLYPSSDLASQSVYLGLAWATLWHLSGQVTVYGGPSCQPPPDLLRQSQLLWNSQRHREAAIHSHNKGISCNNIKNVSIFLLLHFTSALAFVLLNYCSFSSFLSHFW